MDTRKIIDLLARDKAESDRVARLADAGSGAALEALSGFLLERQRQMGRTHAAMSAQLRRTIRATSRAADLVSLHKQLCAADRQYTAALVQLTSAQLALAKLRATMTPLDTRIVFELPDDLEEALAAHPAHQLQPPSGLLAELGLDADGRAVGAGGLG